MKYHLHQKAKKDLSNIWEYTASEWGLKQADKYYLDIITCLEELSKNPELGTQRSEIKPGYRSFPQGSHIIFYIITDSEIEIIRIPHQQEDVKNKLK